MTDIDWQGRYRLLEQINLQLATNLDQVRTKVSHLLYKHTELTMELLNIDDAIGKAKSEIAAGIAQARTGVNPLKPTLFDGLPNDLNQKKNKGIIELKHIIKEPKGETKND